MSVKKEEFSKEESKPKEKKIPNKLALMSYIGPLCLIPILTKEKDEFVKFHVGQGLILFICELTTWIILSVIPFLWFLSNFFGLLWFVLIIIGIMNVVNGQRKKLPLIGDFAGKIKI